MGEGGRKLDGVKIKGAENQRSRKLKGVRNVNPILPFTFRKGLFYRNLGSYFREKFREPYILPPSTKGGQVSKISFENLLPIYNFVYKFCIKKIPRTSHVDEHLERKLSDFLLHSLP